MLRIIFMVSVSILLSGCASKPEPEAFGIRESIWKTLTPQQQNIILKSYTRDKESVEVKKK